MKKIVLVMIFFNIFNLAYASSKSLLEYEEPTALCSGSIVFPCEIDPLLCLYYKGNKLGLDVSHEKICRRIGQVTPTKKLVKTVPYLVSETKDTQVFHILICCKPEFASHDNTISYLYVPEDIVYKFYTLSGARKYGQNNEVEGCTWTIIEESLLDDRIIPDNTIIFLFQADFVEGLDARSWPINSNVRILPNIVIKKNIDTQEILRAVIEARLAGIDFDTIHAHTQQTNTKIENKTVVTIS